MTPQILTTRDTPYKGLLPYDEGDAAFFFGRESESDIITANLLASRLTVLYGASGVGKSSVLRAEVAYQLRELAREEFDARGQATSAISIYSSWTDDPLAGLRSQIAADVEQLCGQSLSSLADLSFHDFLAKAAKLVGGKLLIVLDQFEEYFIYSHREGPGSFAPEFVRAVNSHESGTNFLISIREDWLARLDRFKTDIPKLFDNYLRIDRLDHNSAIEAIEGPAKKYNELRQPNEPEVVIAPGFSEAVLSQLERLANKNVLATTSSGEASDERAVDARIQTPYLQLVMTRLWSEALAATEHVLSPAMLAHPDRCEQIIQNHLDDVMDKLPPAAKDIAARVFKQLVTPSGTKFAQAMGDLAGYAEVSRDELSPVLKTLSKKEAGVLSEIAPSPGQTDARYEISTDVLAAAILDWRRRYVDAQEQLEIAQNLNAERARAESEARSARRFRWLAFAMVIVSMVAFATAAYALSQRSKAAENRRQADEAKKKADEANKEAADWAKRAKRSEDETKGLVAEIDRKTEEFGTYRDASIKEIEKQRKEADDATALAARKTDEAKRATQASENEVAIRKISNEAKNLYREGEKLEAARKYQTILPRLPHNDPRGRADMVFDIGDIFTELIQPPDLTREQKRALEGGGEAAQELESQLEDQKESTRGFLSEAERALTEASKNYRASGDVRLAAKALTKLAAVFDDIDEHFSEAGDKEKSVHYNEAALETLDQSPKPEDYAKERIDILDTLIAATGVTDKRKSLRYAKALRQEYAKDQSKKTEEIQTTERIANLHRDLKEKDPAIAAYEEVLRYYQSTNNRRQEVIVNRLGMMLYDLGDKEAALNRFEQALVLLDNPNLDRAARAVNDSNIAVALGRIGKIHYEQGRKQLGFDNYEKAANVYDKVLASGPLPPFYRDVVPTRAANLNLELGALYQAEGDKPNKVKAIVAYNRAATLQESDASWLQAGKIYSIIADIYASMGDTKNSEEFVRKVKEAAEKAKAERLDRP